jgi:K+-transporting ATPase ATPase C chain
MSVVRDTGRAVRMTLVLWVVTAIIYPGVMLLVGLAFPYQANGSLLKNSQGQVVGSALIGQPFTSNRYFWSRPSTVDYSTADPKSDKNNVLKTGTSGASNLAPSNPDLLKQIRSDINKLQKAGIKLTSDLVYTSGSGLDPHISIESANAQIERLASVRSLSPDQVRSLIAKNTDGRFLGIFGEPGVNVLKLNLALDGLKPR